jgi:MFS family permease
VGAAPAVTIREPAVVDPPPDDRRPRGAARLGPGSAFWVVGLAFTFVMAFSTVPTALYPAYVVAEGFGPFTVTLVFSVYVLGVLASLLFAAHLSDIRGRRRLALPAVGLTLVAAVIFASSTALPALLVARVVSGLAVGMMAPTATAWLTELHLAVRGGTDRSRAEAVATTANLGGLGLGPVLAGAVALVASSPLRLPYVVMGGLLALTLLGVLASPETVVRPVPVPAYRPQRPALPATGRARFLLSGSALAVGFTLLGFYTSLAPSLLESGGGRFGPVVTGMVVFGVFLSAVATQLAVRSWRPRVQVHVGLGALGLAAIPIALAAEPASVPLLALAGVIGGAGTGLAFRGAIGTTLELSAPERRGGTLATLYVVAYLGLTLPVLGLGVLAEIVGLSGAIITFAGTVLAATVLIGLGLRHVGRSAR